MNLKNRVKKLDRGGGKIAVIFIPDGLSEADEDAFVQAHLRSKRMPLDHPVYRMNSRDAAL